MAVGQGSKLQESDFFTGNNVTGMDRFHIGKNQTGSGKSNLIKFP